MRRGIVLLGEESWPDARKALCAQTKSSAACAATNRALPPEAAPAADPPSLQLGGKGPRQSPRIRGGRGVHGVFLPLRTR